MKHYITLKSSICFELEVKRSRFIALASPVQNEEEFKAFLAAQRSAYPQARHYVYAWILGGFDEQQAMQKYSDDGEPSGTGGLPILKKMQALGLSQAAVVVIRYFGGVLLGTGGLSRAYAGAAEGALEAAGRLLMKEVEEFDLRLPYTLYEPIKAKLLDAGFPLFDEHYGEQVDCRVAAADGRSAELGRLLAELSAGSIAAKYIRSVYRPFAMSAEADLGRDKEDDKG